MKGLKKQEAVLLGLLSVLAKEVLRTNLVKMIYLLDNLSFEQRGKELTDFAYHWDYHGPNAVGNAITVELAHLSEKGLVQDTQKLTPYENYANYYRIGETVDPSELPLSSEEWVLIHSIAKRYGSTNRPRIVSESKKTLPMQGAKQFEILKFQPNPKVEALRKSFFADSDFVCMTSGVISSSAEKINLDELRDQVAQPANVR